MKYTVIVRENETGEETAYEGEKIICALIRATEDGEQMVAEGHIDVSAEIFASWLASSDFYDDLLGWLMMHTLNKMLPGEKVEPLPGDGTCPLRHERGDAMN